MSENNKVFSAEDKKQYAEKKKAELSSAYTLINDTIEKIFTKDENPKEVVKLLDIFSKFSNLGMTNSLLIYAQYPLAKDIQKASYWNDHNYFPKKGQKSFALIERGAEYTKNDGTKGYARNIVKYFDVSQTNAPEHIADIKNYNSHALIKALLLSCPISYKSYDESMANSEDTKLDDNIIAKYYPQSREIVIRKNLSHEVFFAHFSIALAMSMLDRGKDFVSKERMYKFDATCIAYLLCKKYNIDTSIFDFDDIPSEYMSYDTTTLKKKLYEIVDVNKSINEKMYKSLKTVTKQYQETIDNARS